MITAKIIADSMSPQGVRITTMELEYPRFIHSELMTHRVFSRNAASSRAIPIQKMIEQVVTNPEKPVHWGKNQSGMQAKEELDEDAQTEANIWWGFAAGHAAACAEMLDAQGLHKQVVNRILEPFQRMKTVVTSTEWENFFELRNHTDAQPEIQVLAREMSAAMEASSPQQIKVGQWHLPYVDFCEELGYTIPHDGDYENGGYDLTLEQAQKVSASCCAQVSYRVLDNSIEKAEMIFDKLITSEPRHASPFEHLATPIKPIETKWYSQQGVTHQDRRGGLWSGNLRGWVQFRQIL